MADITKAETGWSRLNRAIEQMTVRLAAAQFEEDFQSIGHLAREAFISLGQAVYDPARHPSEDSVTSSETDAKRMLTAYVAAELSGANEEARRFARAAVVYADAVTHKRSAGRLDAELIVAAIESVVKVSRGCGVPDHLARSLLASFETAELPVKGSPRSYLP
ncbi:MAG TPA: hypothetical protein VEK37_07910 [Gemmatimonadaceae bacterium]|nr:hypothetical protein [Gemmatimonadaceae bacterium]